jgi:alpha-L-arabinofuranosidase
LNLEFLATTLPSTALTPAYKKSESYSIIPLALRLRLFLFQLVDFHQYNSASWFEANAFFFDSYPRNGTQWFVGEYAVTSTNDSNALPDIPGGRLQYPTLAGATAEAAFMTGMERNSDVVFASACEYGSSASLGFYANSSNVTDAPSFQHIDSYAWTPDIITYDAGKMVKSTSYYVQEVCSHYTPTSGTS